MILATLRSGSIDGTLVLVHPNRQTVGILPSDKFSSLLQLLDTWDDFFPRLIEIDSAFRRGAWTDTRSVEEVTFTAPLPRTWAFLDGSAFVNHVILARKARGALPPEDLLTVPLMYQGVSHSLLGPCDPIQLIDESFGYDFEAEIGVITGEVKEGCTSSQAERQIRFVTLFNDISLRNLVPREVGTGFGFIQSKPPSSFAPFLVSPDELGQHWRDGRLQLPVQTSLNGRIFGNPVAGEMHFSFGDLLAHAAKTRTLSAGTIVGSGTVSNSGDTVGSSCIVERRMIEQLNSGAPKTPYLKIGDEVNITVSDDDIEIFGAIRQQVVSPASS